MRRLLPFAALLAACCAGQRPAPEANPVAARSYRAAIHFGSVAHPTLGEVFTTTNGKWKHSPTSFAYQWERCNTSGGSCSNISMATASSHTVVAADEGHTLRSAVTASNAYGSATATSAATGLVEPAGEEPSLTEANCFHEPERAGCKYPGAHNEGPNKEGAAHCASLISSGSKTVNTEGETVEGLNITGAVTVAAAKVTFNNDCLTGSGGEGNYELAVGEAAKEFTITNSTIRGSGSKGAESVEEAIRVVNQYASTKLTAANDYMYYCGECVHRGEWKLTHDYIITNGGEGSGTHFEDVYLDSESGKPTLTENFQEDTFLNPYAQTATVFSNTKNGSGGHCAVQLTIERSFMAGGGYTVYPCSNATESGGVVVITHNRFARCLGTEHADEGGFKCGTGTVKFSELPQPGADEHGYWPKGGYDGVHDEGASTETWEHNFWDDTVSEAVPG